MMDSDELTNAVLPARTQTMRTMINRYAVLNGIMFWSTRDMPVFAHAPITWKKENLPDEVCQRWDEGKNHARVHRTRLGRLYDVAWEVRRRSSTLI